MKKISIIIVNYKTSQMTLNCITAIIKVINSVPYEIIVVDNNSQDDSVKLFKNMHNNIKVIELHKNLGYGTAINKAIKITSGQFLVFLNSDIVLSEDFSQYLIDFYQKNNAGVLGIKLVGLDGKFQKTFGYFPSPMLIVANHISFLRKINHPHLKRYAAIKSNNPETQKIDWITGAFMFISKENFELIGGFDENYFMFYEDVDLCKRASALNLNNYYISEYYAIHNHCATVKSMPKGRYNFYKAVEKESSLYYLEKYFPTKLPSVISILYIVFTFKLVIMLIKYSLQVISKKQREKNKYKINSIIHTFKILKTKKLKKL